MEWERFSSSADRRSVGEGPLLFGLGIHGQYLFVDHRKRTVVAIMSSQADPIDAAPISLTMTAVAEFRRALAVPG
jgi:hypothetical protein